MQLQCQSIAIDLLVDHRACDGFENASGVELIAPPPPETFAAPGGIGCFGTQRGPSGCVQVLHFYCPHRQSAKGIKYCLSGAPHSGRLFHCHGSPPNWKAPRAGHPFDPFAPWRPGPSRIFVYFRFIKFCKSLEKAKDPEAELKKMAAQI